ncbi:ABC transporter substrate-binding protein [Paenibacillus agaridevorans]|uniref:ABC transporter substrate-binding protein n=2 Tax=Paenibacillus agaridevorans TaxID=171404 RepID=A0A2R5ELE1_9BACL|nr:ABC transporter substrate-binding protein [Paenibacillus agaridevorans]
MLVLITAIVLTAAGCSSNGNSTTNKKDDNNVANSNEGKTAENPPATDSNKKMTITAMKFVYGNIPPSDGKGLEMINEKFNIEYKPTLVVQSDYVQKLSAVVASGNIPDIISMEAPDSNFYKWAKQGAFLPLNDFISQYETFKNVPENVLKTFTVDGNIYALPHYFPLTYTSTPMIRKDWLDNLGLQMPTNYEELKQVAIAFTTNDPDKNGQNDTYGIAMSQNINPSMAMGAYWDPGAWYNKDAQGNLIPGIISDARKDVIAWFADLYKAGAITKDFALMNWANTNKEFYSGKAGIFIATPRGMSSEYMSSLIEANPNVQLEMIPPFVAPDGSQGFSSSSGYYKQVMLSAKLKDDPEKVKRILELLDYGRNFYAADQMTQDNKDFDWINGLYGVGYTIEDGVVKKESEEKGLTPAAYFDAIPWAPNDAANGYSKQYKVPLLSELTAKAEKMHAETKHYLNPGSQVFSETRAAKSTDLDKKLFDDQTKMIVGEKPISDWDQMVYEWKNMGGAKIITEINDAVKAASIQGEWK